MKPLDRILRSGALAALLTPAGYLACFAVWRWRQPALDPFIIDEEDAGFEWIISLFYIVPFAVVAGFIIGAIVAAIIEFFMRRKNSDADQQQTTPE